MSMISMRTCEVSLRAVTFCYLWCAIRSCSPRISGVHECRNEGKSQPKCTFLTNIQYVNITWSGLHAPVLTGTGCYSLTILQNYLFVSFYSLNVKGYFQSLAYDVWKPKLKVFSLYYLRKSVQSVKIWQELTMTSTYHGTRPPSCNLLMMPFEFELYGTSQVFRFQII